MDAFAEKSSATPFVVPKVTNINCSSEAVSSHLITSNENQSIPSFNTYEFQHNTSETIDITPDKSGGVLKRLLQIGEEGEFPGDGDIVSVRFTGWLLSDPEKPVTFDSNLDSELYEFQLGRGMVVKGWDIAIATMKKNEISVFIIQPEYAYGEAGYSPKIPPHTPLLFEVQLYGWKLEDISPKKDGSILRKNLHKGDGTICPNDGSFVSIRLLNLPENENVEENEKNFILGEGCRENISEGIELALLKFHLNEKSLVFLKNKYADDGIEEEHNKYEVTLLNFSKVKDVWEMNSDEKLENAKVSKQKGVLFFQEKYFKAAMKQFKNIVKCLENEPGVSLDTEEERNILLLSGYLNIALCQLKLENYFEVIKVCDKALKFDPGNEKALFRRGQAKLNVNNSEDALKDFQTLCSIYPNNKAATNYIYLCKESIKKQVVEEKSIYNEMFDKFKKQDELRMKNMKTETGIWEDDAVADRPPMTEVQKLLEESNSALRDANIIELSNTAI